MYEGSHFSVSLPTPDFFFLFLPVVILSGYEVISHYGFDFHLPSEGAQYILNRIEQSMKQESLKAAQETL